ncbi:hypothetical protein I6N96_09055 [Enterococcus sp. BWM-S5]|uniref:Uncharacterized protein n=1 Tax=Enterococcus larvae TaxID=2794352 RepID=A0ABS4CIP0_9ENTE|nr:hypothetical protein [Enterococcus larvae]MBP1046431.1 hypothetical protein [Enterococcus larvae]
MKKCRIIALYIEPSFGRVLCGELQKAIWDRFAVFNEIVPVNYFEEDQTEIEIRFIANDEMHEKIVEFISNNYQLDDEEEENG